MAAADAGKEGENSVAPCEETRLDEGEEREEEEEVDEEKSDDGFSTPLCSPTTPTSRLVLPIPRTSTLTHHDSDSCSLPGSRTFSPMALVLPASYTRISPPLELPEPADHEFPLPGSALALQAATAAQEESHLAALLEIETRAAAAARATAVELERQLELIVEAARVAREDEARASSRASATAISLGLARSAARHMSRGLMEAAARRKHAAEEGWEMPELGLLCQVGFGASSEPLSTLSTSEEEEEANQLLGRPRRGGAISTSTSSEACLRRRRELRQAADAAKARVQRLQAVVEASRGDMLRANEVEARCWHLLAAHPAGKSLGAEAS